MKYSILIGGAVIVIGAVTYMAYFAEFDKVDDKPDPVKSVSQDYVAGSYKVQVAIFPQPPKVGHNQLEIVIKDKDDNPVNHARIKAVAEMPAMGSMPTMYAPADISYESPAYYQGSFQLPMMGAWPITVTIDTQEYGQAKLSFDMGTSRKGLGLSYATPSTFATDISHHVSAVAQPNTFKVDAYRRQLIGVTTGTVTCLDMVKTINASAKVSIDQTRLTDINLKFDGWVEQLNADYVGKKVTKGDILFTVYSPELLSSQEEYLQSFRRSLSGQSSLKVAASKRLLLWDIDQAQIKALERRGRVLAFLPILSPVTGTIIEKKIVAGGAFKARSKLLRIADLSTLWVEGQVLEADLSGVTLGMVANVMLENQPDKPIKGVVTFIDPFLDAKTRTARVRVELTNADGMLRPDQYVKLKLEVNIGETLVVPEQAVIFSGENRVVFLDLGEGRLQAKKIKIGARSEGYIEVLEGLEHGDAIITSGNFLIASESKLKLGVEQW